MDKKGILGNDKLDGNENLNELCVKSIELIDYARRVAAKQVNIVQLMTFYALGQWIVREQGDKRAKYGQYVIKKLSVALTEKYGRGFSEDTLKNARKFYLTYQDRISETAFSLFAVQKSETVFSLFGDNQWEKVIYLKPDRNDLLLMKIRIMLIWYFTIAFFAVMF